MPIKSKPILFYDGYCPVCNSSVKICLFLDFRKRLFYAPLQGKTSASIQEVQQIIRINDSLLLLFNGRVYLKSEAVIQLLSIILTGSGHYLKFPNWIIHSLDFCYDIIARNRYKLGKRFEECPLPPLKNRNQFLS
ncbi:MAG: DCC1-like thiol-disulfide oxidoreductase family protein [Bacteroidetes bacterium]|nr:DCC1-like thiol-disulfide oxidoreductase family protein [Bacteroidota bacterium]